MSSGTEKIWFPFAAAPSAATPFFNLTDLASNELTSTLKVILAVDDFFDLGTYPMFRANATTFSRNVALSMNDSLTAMLVL